MYPDHDGSAAFWRESKMVVSGRLVAVGGILATIAAALISSYTTDYFSRANPVVFVTAIGFGGPLGDESIEINDAVVALSARVDFVGSLKKFESYRKLNAYDSEISELRQSLDKSITSLETWQKLYGATALTKAALEDNPLITDARINELLMREFEAQNTSEAPTSLNELIDYAKKNSSIFPVSSLPDQDQNLRWVVWKTRGNMTIVIPRAAPDFRRTMIEQYIRSLEVGNQRNIAFYIGMAQRVAQKDLLDLAGLQDQLRKILLPISTLTAKLYFSNNGQRATTIRPYFGLKVLHPSFKDRVFVLAADVTSETGDESPFELTSKGFTIRGRSPKNEGKDVVALPFLPSGNASQYINLGPNESKTVSVSGINKLGGDTGTLVTILQSGLLKFKIIALTVDGAELWSAESAFSGKIGNEQEEDVRKRVLGR